VAALDATVGADELMGADKVSWFSVVGVTAIQFETKHCMTECILIPIPFLQAVHITLAKGKYRKEL
jgi:hypothetical protein